ncbi:MAG: type II toxin-antitoxin system prevent-host-death family antitoxin [Gammaproteobacteria bacterium]
MKNTITVAELKRRGMAAIEEALTRGPVHIIKRNKPAAVILSEAQYRRLASDPRGSPVGMTAIQWLLAQPSAGKRTKKQIDADLKRERDW